MNAMRRFVLSAIVGLLVAIPAVPGAEKPADAIVWHAWSPEIFAQAKRENKFILLDLEAVWCHWCHVMAETTYPDPAVVKLMQSRYLAVRVDQDSRPDLSNRYEDYGWPATVIFAPDGSELVKRQGYVPPKAMAALLQAVIDDPTPGPSVRPETIIAAGTATELGESRRAELLHAWNEGYDEKAGGWGFSHKFLDWDSVELALHRSPTDPQAAQQARDTLRLQRKLIDPVWGGVYQYSVGGDWNEPHFEKIMQMQAENLRIYALAYARWHDPADLESARAIYGYLRLFLTSPDGVVYTSQDADLVPGEHSAEYYALDDAARRGRGTPRIDQHIYARENGWVIVALCQLAATTGDNSYRVEAERAARWVLAHRALPGGGFSHDAKDVAGPYLGDTLAMGRAFLALHQLTQNPEWLEHAVAAGQFIAEHFSRGTTTAGFASSDTTVNAFPAPRPQFDENVSLARWGIGLAATSGRPEFRTMAATALRWLLAPGATDGRAFYVAGLLLAEEEARTDPVHVAVVGRRDDPVAQAMFAAALRLPDTHKLVESWDRREGPAPRGEDIYPELEYPAAFLCANGACSSPIKSEAALSARLAKVK